MSNWKNGLPPVGEVCEVLWNGVWVEALIKFLGSNIVVFDLNGEEESSYYTTEKHCCPFRPLKSEAELKREKDIEKLAKTLSVSCNHLTPKSSFVFKRIEELEQGTMCMSYNDGPAKGIIRDLYRVVDNDDGSKELAEILYDAGYRQVNELTDEQIEEYIRNKHYYNSDKYQESIVRSMKYARSQIMGKES